MRSNRGRDTGPEIAVRRLLHGRGLRYRVDLEILSEHPRRRVDIVFPRVGIAVFIDGCLWHGCPEHASIPKSNAQYWLPRLARNIERDRETDDALRSAGWVVLRFWEHQRPVEVADVIEREVRARR